jgi:hypothetical protein
MKHGKVLVSTTSPFCAHFVCFKCPLAAGGVSRCVTTKHFTSVGQVTSPMGVVDFVSPLLLVSSKCSGAGGGGGDDT